MAPTRGPYDQGPVAELIHVKRGGGGERVLTTLTPQASRAYTIATLRAATAAELRLGLDVVANRIGAGGRPEPWRRARARWRCDLAAAVREGSVGAIFKGDVQDCYGSMPPGLVGRRLTASGGDAEAVGTVLDVLDACAGQGVRGLPVGPVASGFLANVVLMIVDVHLRATGLPHRRWVDDVVVVAPHRRGATVAHDAFRRALDELGLEPNLGKTRVLDRPVDVVRLASGSGISPAATGAMG
jgi:hypothetical protein